jgi:hypothetical protein
VTESSSAIALERNRRFNRLVFNSPAFSIFRNANTNHKHTLLLPNRMRKLHLAADLPFRDLARTVEMALRNCAVPRGESSAQAHRGAVPPKTKMQGLATFLGHQ